LLIFFLFWFQICGDWIQWQWKLSTLEW
jgi:hypothetical protein